MTIHVAYHHWIITLLLDNRDHTHKNKPIMFLILPTISWAEWDIWVNLGLYPCTLMDSYLNLRNSLAFASLSSQGNKNPKKATSNTTQLTIGHPQLYSSFIVRTRLYQHHSIGMQLVPHVQYLQHHNLKLFLELFYIIFWILNHTWTGENWKDLSQELIDPRCINLILLILSFLSSLVSQDLIQQPDSITKN